MKKGAPLEAFIFKGGFGDSYVKAAETVYNSEYGITVKHTGTQGLGPKLQPRFASDSPPDVMDNSGADNLDTASLAKQGKLLDLTPLLDATTVDDPSKKVRDVLIAGTVEQGQFGTSAMYALNYAFTVYGTWYSNKLFKDEGLGVPEVLRRDDGPVRQDQGRRDLALHVPGQVPVLPPLRPARADRQGRRQGRPQRHRRP